MTADFRALCAELADRLDDALTYTVQSDTERSMRQLITRDRDAACARPRAATDCRLITTGAVNHENTNRPTSDRPLRFQPTVRFDEGMVQRGNGDGGPATPKPKIIPKPQFPTSPDHPGRLHP